LLSLSEYLSLSKYLEISMSLLFKRPFNRSTVESPATTTAPPGKPWQCDTVKRRKVLFLMAIVILSLLGTLGSRLVYLQLVDGSHWRRRAEENRVRMIARQPERGRILDRQGRTLVGSKLSHSVFLWPAAKQDRKLWDQTLPRLAEILHKPEAELRKRLEQIGYDSIDRVRVARRITPDQVTAIAEAGDILKGVEVDAETTRIYPYGKMAAHVLGYTGELSDEEYQQLKSKGYRLGDVNGKLGVEAVLESQLRGEWGGQQVEVDGMGRVKRVLGEKSPRMGQDVHLTLDISLQKAAEAALGEQQGAVVVLDPRDGSILAMTSRPTFDPNLFSKDRVTEAEWGALQKLANPFVNRAVQAFQPASTFKIVTTTAAIESGKWPADTVLPTLPSYTIGGTTFGEWNGAGFGPLGFAGAIMNSSDTFFYQIAGRIDGAPFTDWMHRYGLGQKTGVELPDESAGTVPDASWKQKVVGEEWRLGDSINMSIGQGFVTASPLQMATIFAVAANGGDRIKPHLLQTNEAAKQGRQSLHLQPETLRILQEGLRGVVTQGTGQEYLDVGYLPPIAGKSGTSEDLGQGSDTWFAAYAPAEKPEIVVVVFAEKSGGSGGKVSAPIVRQVMEAYFQPKQPSEPQSEPVPRPEQTDQVEVKTQ
jgi:penicillin-binding protein 2